MGFRGSKEDSIRSQMAAEIVVKALEAGLKKVKFM
jgi:hypothetical protein